MFDIGFSEIVLIAVVALLVVGPREFPTLVRNIGSMLGKTRQFMNAVKSEFDKEIHKADEIKRLMSKEAEIAELHKNLDLERRADRPTAPQTAEEPRREEAPPPVSTADTASVAKQDHGSQQT